MTGLDGDGGLARPLHQVGEVCREITEDVFHTSMMIHAAAAAHQPIGQVTARYLGQV